jgi:hypothetical protein
MVIIDGIAAAGLFAPFVDCANVHVLGSDAIPEPCVAPAARMAGGELFGEWVQVEGVVRDVAKEPGKALLFVSSGGLRFHAVIQPFTSSTLPVDWLDARVALRGVCWTDVDAENKPTGFTLYVPGTNHVLFLQAGVPDIFRQPAIPSNSPGELLRQSDTRMKVVGTVAFQSPSGYVYLQRDDGAVRARLLVPLARGNQQARYVERPPVIPLRPVNALKSLVPQRWHISLRFCRTQNFGGSVLILNPRQQPWTLVKFSQENLMAGWFRSRGRCWHQRFARSGLSNIRSLFCRLGTRFLKRSGSSPAQIRCRTWPGILMFVPPAFVFSNWES